MIRSIEMGTHCRMLIGQNGVVVVVGSPEDTLRAISAVKLVQDEAHAPDLTERVQKLLGVSPQDVQQESQTKAEGPLNLENAAVPEENGNLSNENPSESRTDDE